jgi:small conductance mechanosensitive channel
MEVLVQTSHGVLVALLLKILAAVAILVLGWLLARFLTRTVRRLMARAGVDPTLVGFFSSLLYIGLLTVVVIAALDRLGFPTVSFVAVVGAVGLVIGLALKGTLSNLACGVMLIALRPFQVGDKIEAAGVSGVVEVIQVFATTVRADDAKRIMIPNSAIAGGNITNYSARQ